MPHAVSTEVAEAPQAEIVRSNPATVRRSVIRSPPPRLLLTETSVDARACTVKFVMTLRPHKDYSYTCTPRGNHEYTFKVVEESASGRERMVFKKRIPIPFHYTGKMWDKESFPADDRTVWMVVFPDKEWQDQCNQRGLGNVLL